MKTSYFMAQILRIGYVYCDDMDKVVDIQEESVFVGILVDYIECIRVDCPDKVYKVFWLGFDFTAGINGG